MAKDLLTPILNDRTRSVNFFNGRLLTGEDLTAEQKANRVAHGLLGQAIGSGVAYGLEVSESKLSSTVQLPVLKITQGLAINRNGATLLLDQDTEIALTRPAPGPAGAAKIFDDCEPVQSGVYVAGAGIYLLTVGPAAASQGLAEVSGVNTGTAPCNSKYKAEGVQFRRVQIDLTQLNLGLADLTDKRLRNLVAYKFFGVDDWASVIADPFGIPPANFSLIDQLRSQKLITDCEVPLAIFYWTATGGLIFVDMWAVRRLILNREPATSWGALSGKRYASESLAMFMQFQNQVSDLVNANTTQGALGAITAQQYFRYLPAAGFLPIAGAQTVGFNYVGFFGSKTSRGPIFIEGAKAESLMHLSLNHPPVDLNNPEMIWLYWVRENMRALGQAPAQPYLIFTNGHIPFQGLAQFDLNYWGYADFI